MSSKDERDAGEDKVKILKQGILIFILCVIIAALLLLIFRIIRSGGLGLGDRAGEVLSGAVIGEEGETVTFSEASIRKVFEISDLSTADYIYNAVARAYDEDGVTVRYYVAYEGRIKAGIDFSKIEVDIDEEGKTITITIPEIEFQEKTVNPGTLEFIFRDKKSETENIHQEAYLLCENDLKEKINREQELMELARANAISVVEALVTPWMKQVEEEYIVEFQWEKSAKEEGGK